MERSLNTISIIETNMQPIQITNEQIRQFITQALYEDVRWEASRSVAAASR